MQYAKKSFWTLFLIFLTLAVGQCGRKSSPRDAPSDAISIPAAWDGEEDWSGNVLRVEDIAP